MGNNRNSLNDSCWLCVIYLEYDENDKEKFIMGHSGSKID